jgi:hypothetical protein
MIKKQRSKPTRQRIISQYIKNLQCLWHMLIVINYWASKMRLNLSIRDRSFSDDIDLNTLTEALVGKLWAFTMDPGEKVLSLTQINKHSDGKIFTTKVGSKRLTNWRNNINNHLNFELIDPEYWGPDDELPFSELFDILDKANQQFTAVCEFFGQPEILTARGGKHEQLIKFACRNIPLRSFLDMVGIAKIITIDIDTETKQLRKTIV